MKAIVIRRFGGPEVFEQVELPTPKVGPRQVLIRVAATAVNPLDYKLRRGDLPGFTHSFPAILHSDVAGTLVEVGHAVQDLHVGDRVYGCAGGVSGRQGALAEYMLADADLVARQPESLNAVKAAVLPLVSITAWEGLIDRVEIRAGQRVLVHGGTGGVGHIAAQLAKWQGAQVFTTVSSTHKAELSRRYGADVTINYREQRVADYVQSCTQGEGFDVVVDTFGGAVLQDSLAATKVGGQVLTTLAAGPIDLTQAWARKLSLHCLNMSWPMASGAGMAHHGFILSEVARLVDEGAIRPLLDPQRFTFDEVHLAHAHAESDAAIGKVSIRQL